MGREKVKGELKREGNGYIVAPSMDAYLLITFSGGVQHRVPKEYVGTKEEMKLLSPNERKTLIADCEKQIDEMPTGDCPTVYREMLANLKYGK